MNPRYELQAGIFILLGLIILAFSVLLLGRERQIFARQIPFSVSFQDIRGLTKGAPVRLGGITIGRVSDIGFSKNDKDSRVYVTLLINEDSVDRIRSDSVATIETQGLLGDRFMAISVGMSDTPISAGSELPGQEPGDVADVLKNAGVVAEQAAEAAKTINTFVGSLEKDTLKSISDASATLSRILSQLETGDGLLNRLIYSKKEGDKILDDLNSLSADLSSLVSDVKNGEGLIHALIYDPEGKEVVNSITEASTKLGEGAAAITEIAAQIKDGNGLAHELIYADRPGGITEIITSLNTTAKNLERTSASLSDGSGTLGALLVDSKLYDNLVEVTGDAKRSVILRYAIEQSLEKMSKENPESLPLRCGPTNTAALE